MELLSLENAGLTGLLPSFIFNITSLKVLNLPDNKLYGGLPWDMCSDLHKLEALILRTNKPFTGGIPTSIGNCTSLMTLSLEELNLSGKCQKGSEFFVAKYIIFHLHIIFLTDLISIYTITFVSLCTLNYKISHIAC